MFAWLAACLWAAVAIPRIASAQIPANERWRTIETRHFRIHFTTPLEMEARHAASVAERAYSNLAQELVRPRGMIDIVVSDATDVSNGAATTIPRNHVVIYARPPVDDPSLESYDDWTVLVLQHELTHIFHLDRTRGWWLVGQHIFGRNPVLFPNYYTPAWLTEGLAVYYESRFTSGGRLEGSYQSAVARSAAIDHLLPAIDQLSLATSRFPYGQSAYVYGSFIWDELARHAGPESIPAFVERSSAATIPFLLDREAKRTFGETFTRAWRDWRDSVVGAVRGASRSDSLAPEHSAFASARAYIVPGGGRFELEPRWVDASTLVYAGNDGRESPGLYQVSTTDTPHRIARRNTLDVNVPAADGDIVFAQGEYIDRFHTRGDLYRSHGGADRRLTFGARLSAPDVRKGGEIVAVQTVPAATRLVTVARDGHTVTPITTVSPDTQWTAPRWSPDGSRIVAVRIARGITDIVVMDGAGKLSASIARGRHVLRSPAWSPDGRDLFFTSDESGVSQLYIVRVPAIGEDSSGNRGPARQAMQLTADPGGVYGVTVIEANRDSVRVGTTVLRGDGYHIAIWTVPCAALAQRDNQTPAASEIALRRDTIAQRDTMYAADPRWIVVDDASRARPYSPWRTLLPAYWTPTYSQETGVGSLIGALTSGSDVLGGHSYAVQAAVNTRNHNVDASAAYSYDRLLNPVLTGSLQQAWSYGAIVHGTSRVGELERRVRDASVAATFVRPRARTYSSATLGAEIEERSYSADPIALLPRLGAFYSAVHRYPTLVGGLSFSNTQRPTLSISPEDGVALSASLRQRWEASTGIAGRSGVVVASAYKSLDLPGFAHHVLALRVAGGAADSKSPGDYDVGGVSGSAFEILPGVAFGGARRTFPIRGFAPASESGIHAVSASGEYRIPVAAPSRGLGLFPVFVDRASIALFSDAGRATCPSSALPACSPGAGSGPTLASVGAELNIDSALQFDVPYRFRFGVAHPLLGATYAAAARLSVYATLGATF